MWCSKCPKWDIYQSLHHFPRHGLLFGQPVALRRQQGPALGGVTRQSWNDNWGKKNDERLVELKDYSSPLKIEDIYIYIWIYDIWWYMGVDFDPVLSCNLIYVFRKWFDHVLIMIDPSRIPVPQTRKGSLVAAGPSVRSSKEVQISATVASPQLARESATDWGSHKSWTCRIPWIISRPTSLRFTATDSWTNSLRHPHSAALRTSLKTTKP